MTVVEIFHDEDSVADNQPVGVEVWPNVTAAAVDVVIAGPPTQTTDPATGKPFAVMATTGKNIYISSSPPASGQFIGDIWIPLP